MVADSVWQIFVSGSLGDGSVTEDQITLIDWGQALPLSLKGIKASVRDAVLCPSTLC
jgi:hypothetical protein